MADYLQYNFYGILNLTGALFSIFLGIFIYVKNNKSPINRAYLIFSISIFIWLFCFGMMSVVHDISDAYIWARLSYVFGVPFISVQFYAFSLVWNKKPFFSKSVLMGYLIATIIVIPFSLYFPDHFDIKVHTWGRYNWAHETIFSRGYIGLVVAFMLVYAYMGVYNIWHGWKESKIPSEKSQFRNVLIAFLIAYTAMTDFLTVLFEGFFPFGILSMTIFNLIICYTVARYNFLESNNLFKKVSLLLLIYASLFVFVVPVMYPAFGDIFKNTPNLNVVALLGFCLSIGIIIGLGPLIYAYLIHKDFWLKGQLSKGFTHELKSPIMNIQGAVEMLKDSDVNGEKQDYIQIIEKNAKRLNTFAGNLLSVAKIQEDKLGIKTDPVNINELVKNIQHQFSALIESREIIFENKINSSVTVWADKEKIRQVFSNLISNSIKFTQGGKIIVDTHQEKNNYLFSVKDDGMGVKDKDQEKIFMRFYQAQGVSKGSGIGLSIAKGWVEAHGGKIWAESEGEGKGTTVTFTLPTN